MSHEWSEAKGRPWGRSEGHQGGQASCWPPFLSQARWPKAGRDSAFTCDIFNRPESGFTTRPELGFAAALWQVAGGPLSLERWTLCPWRGCPGHWALLLELTANSLLNVFEKAMLGEVALARITLCCVPHESLVNLTVWEHTVVLGHVGGSGDRNHPAGGPPGP